MSMNGNGAMALKEKFAPYFTSQGLPPITMAMDLVVEAVNLISSPKDFYYIEIEDAKVLVFEDAHLYQLKAGVISTMHPVKKISYRVTVYDDLGKSVFNQIFLKKVIFLQNGVKMFIFQLMLYQAYQELLMLILKE